MVSSTKGAARRELWLGIACALIWVGLAIFWVTRDNWLAVIAALVGAVGFVTLGWRRSRRPRSS